MRKRTNRRIYKLVDPIAHAKYQASKLTIAEQNEQLAPAIVAMEQLTQGNWDKHKCWQPMFEVLNRIESLTKLNRVNAQDTIHYYQEMITKALDRQKSTGATSFKHDELKALREVVSTYGDLLGEVTHRQFQIACQHTIANVNRIIHDKRFKQSTGITMQMA